MENNRVIMHINYCEQGQSIEYTCRKAREWGFDGIEFRANSGELELDAYLDRIVEACDKEGLRAIHFGGGMKLNYPEADRRDASLEAYLRFYKEALKRFKLTVCTLQTDWLEDKGHPYEHYERHGSVLLTQEMECWQVEGLRKVAAFAENNHFRFALETHHCYPHDLPQAAMKLIAAVQSPALGVALDYGNIVGFIEPPSMEECLAAIGNSLFYIHLKNSFSTGGRYRQRCALGEGEINHRKMLGLLMRQGYGGNYCLESPRPGDREFFAACDVTYFRSLYSEGMSSI